MDLHSSLTTDRITCSRILQHAEPVTFRLCDDPTVDFSTFNSTNSDDFALRQPLKGYSVSVYLKKDKLLYFAKYCSLLNWQRHMYFSSYHCEVNVDRTTFLE